MVKRDSPHTDQRNTLKIIEILLMEEIPHQLLGSISRLFTGFSWILHIAGGARFLPSTVPCVYHVFIFFPDGSAVSVAKTREFLPRSPIQWIQCIGACVKSIMQAISTLDSHN